MESTVQPSQRRLAYAQSPAYIHWELTRACALACEGCPMSSTPHRHPRELSTEEGRELIDEVAEFGTPLPRLTFTGGDLMLRADACDLIAYAAGKRIPVEIAGVASPLLTAEALDRMVASGAEAISLSLDGASPDTHDRFRGVRGSFEQTVAAIQLCHNAGLKVYVSTLVAQHTLVEMQSIFERLQTLPIDRWQLCFLIGVGGSHELSSIHPVQSEILMHWLYDVTPSVPFAIRCLEAPHYRRVVYQRMKAENRSTAAIRRALAAGDPGITDGRGMIYISHVGDVYPSCFLPLIAGNIRGKSLVRIYRQSQLLKSLRDRDGLEGKCGTCEFRRLCGGSRARAHAATGDWMAADPLCAHEPGGKQLVH